MTNRTAKSRKMKKEVKQQYGYFNRQTDKISHEKTWTELRKRNFKREIESILMTAENNALRTSYIKAKINKTQKCWLCGKKRRKD